MNNDMHDFEEFMKRREAASLAFVDGDIGPLNRITTHVSPATIFGPQGDYVVGADKVNTANASGARHSEAGGTNTFEILHLAASGGVAYWAGIQRSTVRMKEKADAIPMNLRVTEIFRREGDDWKLVHRHADSLAEQKE